MKDMIFGIKITYYGLQDLKNVNITLADLELLMKYNLI